MMVNAILQGFIYFYIIMVFWAMYRMLRAMLTNNAYVLKRLSLGHALVLFLCLSIAWPFALYLAFRSK